MEGEGRARESSGEAVAKQGSREKIEGVGDSGIRPFDGAQGRLKARFGIRERQIQARKH